MGANFCYRCRKSIAAKRPYTYEQNISLQVLSMWTFIAFIAAVMVLYFFLRSGKIPAATEAAATKEAPMSPSASIRAGAYIDFEQLLPLLEELALMRPGPSKDEKAKALKHLRIATTTTLVGKDYKSTFSGGYEWKIKCLPALGLPTDRLPPDVGLSTTIGSEFEFSPDQVKQAKAIEAWQDGAPLTLVWYPENSGNVGLDFDLLVVKIIYGHDSYVTTWGQKVAEQT